MLGPQIISQKGHPRAIALTHRSPLRSVNYETLGFFFCSGSISLFVQHLFLRSENLLRK
jgi:hypothetical protein